MTAEQALILYSCSLPPRMHEGAVIHVTCMLLVNVVVPIVGEWDSARFSRIDLPIREVTLLACFKHVSVAD